MTKNDRIFGIVAILTLAVVVLGVIYVANDWHKSKTQCFDCGDGQRCTIDTRQFATKYSTYSLELEANIKDVNKISAKIDPVQLQTLTEAMQSGDEFRKYLVHGFNSCAITKEQYAQMGGTYQAMDGIAREISQQINKADLSQSERKNLAQLIVRYGELSRNLGAARQPK